MLLDGDGLLKRIVRVGESFRDSTVVGEDIIKLAERKLLRNVTPEK